MMRKMRFVGPWLVHNAVKMQACKHMLHSRNFKYIPPHPTTIASQLSDQEGTILDEDIMLLERLSLVDFGNRKGVERLTEAIKFANSIKSVCTEGIEPLYTVQENRSLQLRPDVVEDTPTVDEVLSCAAVTEDEYFVAPPGNVPLEVTNTYREGASDSVRASGETATGKDKA